MLVLIHRATTKTLEKIYIVNKIRKLNDMLKDIYIKQKKGVMEKNQREEENILKKKDQTSKYKI